MWCTFGMLKRSFTMQRSCTQPCGLHDFTRHAASSVKSCRHSSAATVRRYLSSVPNSPHSSAYATPAMSGQLLPPGAHRSADLGAPAAAAVGPAAARHGVALCADGRQIDVSVAEQAAALLAGGDGGSVPASPAAPPRWAAGGGGVRGRSRQLRDAIPFRKHRRNHSSACSALLARCVPACKARTQARRGARVHMCALLHVCHARMLCKRLMRKRAAHVLRVTTCRRTHQPRANKTAAIINFVAGCTDVAPDVRFSADGRGNQPVGGVSGGAAAQRGAQDRGSRLPTVTHKALAVATANRQLMVMGPSDGGAHAAGDTCHDIHLLAMRALPGNQVVAHLDKSSLASRLKR